MPYGGFVPPVVTPPTNVWGTLATSPPVKKTEPLKPAINRRWEDHIDKDIVEAIIAESNHRELKWLQEVLESLRIRNARTGRYLKSDRYTAQIRRIIENGTSRERTSLTGTVQEVPSDWEQE